MAAPLQTGSTVIVYYAKGDETIGEFEGTVATLGSGYLEITTAGGTDVAISWSRITYVLVS